MTKKECEKLIAKLSRKFKQSAYNKLAPKVSLAYVKYQTAYKTRNFAKEKKKYEDLYKKNGSNWNKINLVKARLDELATRGRLGFEGACTCGGKEWDVRWDGVVRKCLDCKKMWWHLRCWNNHMWQEHPPLTIASPGVPILEHVGLPVKESYYGDKYPKAPVAGA